MKEKIIASLEFKKGAAFIKRDVKPICRHQPEGFHVERAQILKAGHCTLDGEEFEFQDIRVYLKEMKS